MLDSVEDIMFSMTPLSCLENYLVDCKVFSIKGGSVITKYNLK